MRLEQMCSSLSHYKTRILTDLQVKLAYFYRRKISKLKKAQAEELRRKREALELKYRREIAEQINQQKAKRVFNQEQEHVFRQSIF